MLKFLILKLPNPKPVKNFLQPSSHISFHSPNFSVKLLSILGYLKDRNIPPINSRIKNIKLNLNFLVNKRYKIILADPPWRYNDERSNDPHLGGITYPTMSDEEIYTLPIQDISDEDCMLFLWATMPKLKEALMTIERWGFRYITCAFVWVKKNPLGVGIYSGLGHWVNGNAELVLLGRKGSPERKRKDVKQIVIAARKEIGA